MNVERKESCTDLGRSSPDREWYVRAWALVDVGQAWPVESMARRAGREAEVRSVP